MNSTASCSPNPLQPVPALPGAPIAVAPGWGFLEWFLISQTVLPALLYLPGTQAFRVPIRVAPFALSLGALLWWVTRRDEAFHPRPHPAHPWLIAVIACVGVMILHPTTNSLAAGTAQCLLYLAVLAPIFWAPSLVGSPDRLGRMLAILLACNAVNAFVGVLQVYDPGRWLPQEFSVIVTQSHQGIVAYPGPDGQLIVRPPGLTDNPGAVCGPGMIAAFFGLAFALGAVALWKRALALAAAFTGVAAIYLSQVRTSLLVLFGMTVLYVAVLVWKRQASKASRLLLVTTFIGLAALQFALLLGGASVAERFHTLIEDDPLGVYYETSRGPMLEHALTDLLVDYPLGAGLARWGMMRTYFGDPWNFESAAIWSELQVSAWILDGGLLLLALYSVALLLATRWDLSLVDGFADPGHRFLACTVFAANAGILALAFGFTPFTTQVGLQYWFLAGLLHGAAQAQAHRR